MGREVYFAECGGKIKIGVSSDIPSRMRQLRQGAGGKVNLLARIVGDFDLERALHNKLKAHRIDGEWFHDCSDVRATIQNCLNNFEAGSAEKVRTRKAEKFKAVCKAIWPDKTAEVLAEIGGTDQRSVYRWMSGEHEPPAIVIAAIIVEMTKVE